MTTKTTKIKDKKEEENLRKYQNKTLQEFFCPFKRPKTEVLRILRNVSNK